MCTHDTDSKDSGSATSRPRYGESQSCPRHVDTPHTHTLSRILCAHHFNNTKVARIVSEHPFPQTTSRAHTMQPNCLAYSHTRWHHDDICTDTSKQSRHSGRSRECNNHTKVVRLTHAFARSTANNVPIKYVSCVVIGSSNANHSAASRSWSTTCMVITRLATPFLPPPTASFNRVLCVSAFGFENLLTTGSRHL